MVLIQPGEVNPVAFTSVRQTAAAEPDEGAFAAGHTGAERPQGRTAVASISTRKAGLASAATCIAERTDRLGWALVPKNWV